ncbi:hypothetical protein FRB90_009792, partial [Tulasnella sp. 427]
MDRSDSTSATPSRSNSTTGTLGYYDRYLSRTQSMSRTMSIARGVTPSGGGSPAPGGGPATTTNNILAPTTRRWTPSHRIGASVGKIEEKLRQMNTGESEADSVRSGTSSTPMSPTWSRSTVGVAAGMITPSSTGLSSATEGESTSSPTAGVVSPRMPRYRLWDQPMQPSSPDTTQKPSPSSSSIGQDNGYSSPKAVLSSSPVVHKRHTLPSFFPPPSIPPEPSTTIATAATVTSTPPLPEPQPEQRPASPTRSTAVLSPSAIERDSPLQQARPESPPTRTFTSLNRGTATTPGMVKRLSGLGSPWAGEAT